RCYRFERNRGPQAARNLGIRRARFSHIAFLDSDDSFTQDKIDLVLQQLDSTPVDLLFHDVQGMPKYGKLARLWAHSL
ncbi:glycosyltransferase, partial [Acinetobacter baumannii]